ncbi:MAG: hypothetical protein V7637_465 [Mycobacteriales bacterium]
MSGWDIQPAGVRGVVIRTQGVAGRFEGELKNVGSALRGAAANGSSQIIAGAISGFADHVTGDIEFAVRRTGAVLHAAVNATNAYLQGDLEMAGHAQAAATAAPSVEDLPGRRGPAGGPHAE